MSVGDHQLHARQAPGVQATQEARPAGAVLGVASSTPSTALWPVALTPTGSMQQTPAIAIRSSRQRTTRAADTRRYMTVEALLRPDAVSEPEELLLQQAA